MNSKIRFPCRRVVALAIAFLLPTIANVALSQDNTDEPVPEYRLEDFNNKPVSETLELTHQILGKGNRNYSGHRLRAVKAIEAAAAVLGVELPERGKGGEEEQAKSDARITLSQRLLDQLRPRLAGQDQQEALGHIDRAMRELSRALRIRAIEDEANREEAALQQ